MKKPAKTWTASALSPNVFRVSIPLIESKTWEHWALVSADRHWDNPKSDRAMQKRHLEQAKERGACVIDCGDLFCAMQGKFDKRASKGSVRPEHQVDNYLDRIVEDAADWFAPYAQNFVSIGHGNHESSIQNKHEIDLTERLVTLMNANNGARVFNGHFSGFVIFSFTRGAYRAGTARNLRSLNLRYDHGWGGGGPVTADMIQHQRRAVITPDADIVVSGHTHDAWVREFQRLRLTDRGLITHDTQTHIKLPTYKDDYADGRKGWHVETGKPPKPLGAWWLRFWYDHQPRRVFFDVIRAQ